jgi:tetratricopeptide (TPR) repeat protein
MMKSSLAYAAAIAAVIFAAIPVKGAVMVVGAGPEQTCYLNALAGSTSAESLRTCNEGLDRDLSLHDRAATFVNRGIILHARGENEEAMADFKHCLSIMPDQADAFFNFGVGYITLKQYDTALADIEKGISLHPSEMSDCWPAAYSIIAAVKAFKPVAIQNITGCSSRRYVCPASNLGNPLFTEIWNMNGSAGLRDFVGFSGSTHF